jgi:hypothetical protein
MRALYPKITPRVEAKMPWHVDTKGQDRRANKAFGEWLSTPPWEWYTTHTFRLDYVSPKQADRAWYAWLNAVRIGAKYANGTSIWGATAPYYFRATEYQDRGTLHYHALVGGVGDLRRLDYKDLWEMYGFARVEAYEAGKGANFYVGKYLTKTQSDIRWSHNLQNHLTV